MTNNCVVGLLFAKMNWPNSHRRLMSLRLGVKTIAEYIGATGAILASQSEQTRRTTQFCDTICLTRTSSN